MRSALVLAILATGCMDNYPPDPDPSPWGDRCTADTDCGDGGDFVCARDQLCRPIATVRTLRVSWSVDGAAASTQTCGDSNLDLLLQDNTFTYHLGFGPIPCEEGVFTVDKMPRQFIRASLAFDSSDVSQQFPTPIARDGSVGFNL